MTVKYRQNVRKGQIIGYTGGDVSPFPGKATATAQFLEEWSLDGVNGPGPGAGIYSIRYKKVMAATRALGRDQGRALPDGSTARGPGYLVGITVPFFIGNVPLIGPQTVNVPMRSFFQLGPGS